MNISTKKCILLCLMLAVFVSVPVVACGGEKTTTTAAPVTTAVTGGATTTMAAETTTTAAPTGETKTLVVGSIMPLSGVLSTVGLAWNRGFELYFDKLNEDGGFKIGNDTYKVKLVEEDGKGAAEAAGAAARKLVSQDGATILMGEIMDAATAAIYDVAATNNVLHVAPICNVAGSPVDVSPTKPLMIRLSPGSDDGHTCDLDFLKEKYPNVKKIAISAPDIGYESMITDFTAAAEARGFTVNYVEKWAWGITDFVPTYTRILASKPDAIFIMVSGQSPYQLMAARQLGFTGPLFGNCPLGPEVHIRVAGAAICTDFFCNGLDPDDPTPIMADIMARWQTKYHDEWVSDAVLAWDVAWCLVQGIQKAQSLDATQILAAFDSMTTKGDLKTSFGDAYMGGKDRFGVNRALVRPFVITYIMQGKMQLAGYFASTPK